MALPVRTQCLTLLCGLLLSGVSQAGNFAIRDAEIVDGTSLALQLDFQPSAQVVEALEASVPLKFELLQEAPNQIDTTLIMLRYAPLLERFELVQTNTVQPFRLRTELLDAFAALRVPAAIGVTRVRLSLSIRDLPGPLRLPALFDGDWWLDSGWVAIKNPAPMKNAAPMKNGGAKP